MDHDKIEQIMNKYQGDASSLIQVLLDIQRENHWLSKEVFERLSEKLDVPLNRIYHIATFYRAFSLLPRGRHEVVICLGTACHVRSSPSVLQRISEILQIEPGETTEDQEFSLEAVNCLGCCALGPMVVVDGKHHGLMNSAKVDVLLRNCRNTKHKVTRTDRQVKVLVQVH